MAEEKEIQSLLCDDLPQAERVMLAQTKMTPGWKIVEKIANAACLRFQQETFKVNPEDANADRKVVDAPSERPTPTPTTTSTAMTEHMTRRLALPKNASVRCL